MKYAPQGRKTECEREMEREREGHQNGISCIRSLLWNEYLLPFTSSTRMACSDSSPSAHRTYYVLSVGKRCNAQIKFINMHNNF